jgi:hypothetical protein
MKNKTNDNTVDETKIEPTTFEKFKSIRDLIVTRAINGFIYRKNWSNEFRIKEIDSIPDTLKRWEENNDTTYTELQPSDLTVDEMKELGFMRWSENSDMMLIPLWIYPFLADVLTTTDINGVTSTLNKSDIDTDHRCGCLAYGITPAKKK